MNTVTKYVCLGLVAIAAAACSRDEVEAPTRFTASAPQTCVAGEEVHFSFSGNAEYIVFYSGEPGNNYEFRHRTNAEADALKLSMDVRQQYNDQHYHNTRLLHVYVSTDFSGEYTPEEVLKATWLPVSGAEAALLPVPVATTASAVETSGSVDQSKFLNINRTFYVAVLYKADGRTVVPTTNNGAQAQYKTRPRIDVTNFRLTAEHNGAATSLQPYFTPVMVSSVGANYKVLDDGLLFQPLAVSGGIEPDEEVWMVSALIDPTAVEPDKGTPLKSIADNPIKFTTHTYATQGEYKPTFVATNANMWQGKEVVRQLNIKVQ